MLQEERSQWIEWKSIQELTVDQALHGVAVASTSYSYMRDVHGDLGEFSRGYLELNRTQVLLEAVDASGARNWDDPRMLCEQPSECHLRVGGFQSLGHVM
ncbi:MAG: hypothetical protein JWP31_976, partial [Aeromicrobium sp.]|nr:hypothetical protein [Aeromicrobium sp.]